MRNPANRNAMRSESSGTSEADLTVNSVARTATEQAGGDAIKATDIMVDEVQKNPTLYKELMDPLVRNACYEAIASIYRQQRRKIWQSPQPTGDASRSRIIALASGTVRTYMDFPLPGGLRLADARRDDVSAAVDFYSKQSKDMASKAKWLQLIAQHMPERKTVKQVMTDARLAELREEASRD